MRLLLAVALLLTASRVARCAPSGAGFQTSLFLKEDQGVARDGEPVAGGIPFPPGVVFDPGHLRVYGTSGKAVPCQAHQLGICWPDGSLRWALVQFQASAGAGKTATYTLRVAPSAPAPKLTAPVRVKDGGDEVAVSTGPMEVAVSRTDFRLPNSVRVAGVQRIGAARLELVADHEHMTKEEFDATGRDPKELATFGLADTGELKWNKIERGVDYSDRLAGPVEIKVEESGPLRAVLRVEKAGGKRAGDLGFVARLYAYAGKTFLRVELSVVNYDEFLPIPPKPDPGGAAGSYMAISNTKHVRRFVYGLSLQLGKVATVEVGTGAGPKPLAPDRVARLSQDSYEAATVESGESKEALKGQSPGWMEVKGPTGSFSLASKYFAEVYPKALAWDASTGQARIELWPTDAPGAGYPLAPGRMRTYELLLGFDTPGAELNAMARAELRPYPDPEYVTGTGTAHRFVPVHDRRFAKYASYVQKTYDAAAATCLHGDIDYGDQIGWNADQRWNGYHGVTHEWFTFYLASGDPRHFRVAEDNVWHSMDVDTFHWGPQAGLREAEYARKQDHICPSPIQGGIKVWNFGEVDYYFLTGKRRALENLRLNAHALLNCGGVAGGVMVPERATSLPFLHLCYMYEALGAEEALAAAYPKAMHSKRGYPFRTDSLGVEESKPYLATLKQLNDYLNGVYDRGEHMKCSFLASYPAEGFHRFYGLTGDKTAADGVLKAGDFLYKKMVIPTGIQQYAGGAPWDVNSPWMPWWDGVEAPAALAYMITHDPKYLDYGKAAVDWILNYRGFAYSSGPWSFQGAMGFGGTLSTYLWALREAGMTEDDLTRMRTDIDYDKALQEIEQKAMEFHEVAMKNTPESGVFCRLAAEAGRVKVNQGRYDEALQWLEKWRGAAYGVYIDWVLERARAAKAHAAQAGKGQ